MLDANMEVEGLRQRLRLKNIDEQTINIVCSQVAEEISMASVDLLSGAMEDAVQAGESKKSFQFVSEVKVIQDSHSFRIGTDSGRTDFSEPPFPMLPKLLKNAKTAQDGSLYKVIPIRAKGNKAGQSRTTVTTEAALKNINAARRTAKEERDARDKGFVGQLAPDALKGMSTFAALQAINEARKSFPTMKQKSTEPVTSFRTASSKQDPAAMWVHPGKSVNMDTTLHDINSRLQYQLDDLINDTINRYEGRNY